MDTEKKPPSPSPTSPILAALILISNTLVAGDIQTDGKLVSTAGSGPPIEVTSTEKVDNLNADQLDGLEGSDLYTQAEVDSLIASLESQIGTLYTQEEVDVLIADLQGQVDQLTADLSSYQSLLDLHEPIFEIKDSVGASVGLARWVSTDSASTVIWDGDTYVSVVVEEEYISVDWNQPIFYADINCTGEAYIRPPTTWYDVARGYSSGFGNSSLLYRSLEGDTPQSTSAASWWTTSFWSGSDTEICHPLSGSAEDLVQAVPLLDFDDFGFVPPFSVTRWPGQ